MFQTLLPNDLIHSPPWPNTILTRPLDDAFLKVTRSTEEGLRKAGYYLKHGIEVNLGLLTPQEARDLRGRKDGYILGAWRQACREQFSRDIAEATPLPFLPAIATQIYEKLETIARQHKDKPTRDSVEWLANWEKAQGFFALASQAEPTTDAVLAKKNFLIAALHLLPQHLGGLDGLIEQRFASEHYGFGWWDGRNMLELRTIPVVGHETTICNYHQVLWRLQQATREFGLVPIVSDALAQPHSSLWRISDNKNMMACDDEDALFIRAMMARTIHATFNLGPLADFSRMYSSNPRSDAPFLGASRVSTVRTCDDNWELRLRPGSGVTHLAQDLFYLTWAAYSSVPEIAKYAERDREKEERDRKVHDMTLGVHTEPTPGVIKIHRVRLEPNPLRVACPFTSCLEAAVLGHDREFSVPDAVFEWNLGSLRKAVGRQGVDYFSTQIDGTIYNLETTIGWRELFKNIRLSEDLKHLELSGIPSSLHKHFGGMKVSSVRPDVYMPPIAQERRNDILGYNDLVKAHFFAKSEMKEVPLEERDMVYGLREIYQFITERSVVFDPQEAVPYLIRLYLHSAQKDEKVPEAKTTIQKAVESFILCAVGGPLSDALRHETTRLNMVACFENHDILRSMISYREAAVEALDVASQFKPAQTKPFFAQLANYLNNPEKLFGFEQLSGILINLARMSPTLVLANMKALAYARSRGRDLVKMVETGKPVHEFDKICKIMSDHGKLLGVNVTTVVAAAQLDDQKVADILRQYKTQAKTLTLNLDQRNQQVPVKKTRPTVLRLRQEFLRGMQSGIIEQAERLIIDRTQMAELRQKALNELAAA